MSSYTIRGREGVIIDSEYFLELPKAPSKQTSYDAKRPGMIRYNSEWQAFEGTLLLTDGTIEYRRFANLDSNGKLSVNQLPDSVVNGLEYKGTFSPVTDDIDPPVVIGQFDNLPAPGTENVGHYFIVRGITDIAARHLADNNPTTSPVIFTPDNESDPDNQWVEIKYYFTESVSNPGVNQIYAAYARLIKENIPDEHLGLLSLADDPDVSAEFVAGDNIGLDVGLVDSDWVISTGEKQQRLRQNRTSINASSVIYDRALMNAENRPFNQSAGTVQTLLDSFVLDGLRRTGDSMYSDGVNSGRLAITYGSVLEPSLTFNNNDYDPETNNGLDPSKWSDPGTGFYHRDNVIGEFGAVVDGKEALRLNETNILFYPQEASQNGNNGESKLTEIGFRPPFINPVDDALGEDGMMAYSPEARTLIQKVDGRWKRISGTETVEISDLSEWVEADDGINWEWSVPMNEPKSLQTQELKDDGSYETVAVENVSITLTDVTIQVPMNPDLRFVGRCIIGI